MDTSLADVTNARHHHLPSSPCPYVEHLLLAGLHMLCSAIYRCTILRTFVICGFTANIHCVIRAYKWRWHDTTDNPHPRIISPPLTPGVSIIIVIFIHPSHLRRCEIFTKKE